MASSDDDFISMGARTNSETIDGVAVTEGVIRVRRRHENDMDFSKYNPFYWEGRTTSFKVEDYTPRGEKLITFTLITEWPQDYIPVRGPDFSAIYTGNPYASEVERSKFAINARMEHVQDFRVFKFDLDERWFNAHAADLVNGKVLTFEFRFFNDEGFEGWIRQKQVNPHNLSAYYSEFFRIRLGQPGLYIDNYNQVNQLPSPNRYSGGWTTTPTTRVEPWAALQQQAFNLSPANGQNFLLGRTWFHTDFVSGRHVDDVSDDKPSNFHPAMEQARSQYAASSYNQTSCNSCHLLNGTALLDESLNRNIHSTIAKTFHEGLAHDSLGKQLQSSGSDKEGDLRIVSIDKQTEVLADGTTVVLNKPLFAAYKDGQILTDKLSIRRPPSLIGMGLLDAIPAEDIKTQATTSPGQLANNDGSIGRFGWKAEQASLKSQIKAALLNDMGVTSLGQETLDCPQNRCIPGKDKLPEEKVELIELYVALLGVPPRMNPDSQNVKDGEAIFHQLQCQTCHRPTWTTGDSKFAELSRQTIHPYTDLLLHDMGEGLADSSGSKVRRLWRTAPLWGLKNAKHATNHHRNRFRPGDTNVSFQESRRVADQNELQFLHDGRAASIEEAILWHGGDAADSVRNYKALSRRERKLLEEFIWDL